ncbi:glycosyltransferase [uncultured Chryseobacterium sp.]|uniref:glycosyltransferase n=1 Tax=uncultured Chryseobacterium sp. TaxID=259322 RepID=UPI0025E879A8|nr:glycosyltransferase [uncultured Chryseobacterium sp.]
MRLCTIIVLFYPEKVDLQKSLSAFTQETDYVFCWKNSSINKECLDLIESYSNVEIIGDETNVGIAKALNEGIKAAGLLAFTHVLTMDQDSYFDEGMITKYKSKIQQYAEESIAIFGINPIQDNKLLYENSGKILDVTDTITSGSIFSIENFIKYGYFEEELFIDAVDYEYCYRLKKKYGLRTVVFNDVILNHSVGYIAKTNMGFSINNYSAFRTYYIIRNQLSIWFRFPSQFPSYYKMTLLRDHILFRIIKIILAEKNKRIKLKSIFLGVLHFIVGRSGYFNVNEKNTGK